MRHEMLTQRALFCHHANTKRGTLSQHFVTHVVPPLGSVCSTYYFVVSWLTAFAAQLPGVPMLQYAVSPKESMCHHYYNNNGMAGIVGLRICLLRLI